jgi:hypothetical protein
MTRAPSHSPRRPVGTATVAERSPSTSQAAVVGASPSMEELARVAGGFVVEWELDGLTRGQQ